MIEVTRKIRSNLFDGKKNNRIRNLISFLAKGESWEDKRGPAVDLGEEATVKCWR